MKDNAKVLNLSTLTQDQTDKLLDKMKIKEYKEKRHVKDRDGGKSGHVLWDAIEKKMEDMGIYGIKKNIQWNKFFNMAGDYDVVKDEGDAIIHFNEPSQVIILNPTSYIQLHRFETKPVNSYKSLAMEVVRKISTHLFGDYRITTKKEGSNRDKVYIKSLGKIDNRIFDLSFSYEQNTFSQKKLDYPLSGELYLSSRTKMGDQYKNVRIRIPLDQSNFDLDAYLNNIIKEFEEFVSVGEHREDMSFYVNALMKQICFKLGFGKIPDSDGESASYSKIYPQGKLFVSVSYIKPSFHCAVVLKNTASWNPHQIYGSGDVTKEEVLDNVSKAAQKLLNQNFLEWESSIDKYYNPDEDKASQWKKKLLSERLSTQMIFLQSSST